MKSSSDLLAERYGRTVRNPKRNRTILIAFAGTIGVIFLGWAAWVTAAGANQVITQDLGFKILSEQQASVKFHVQFPLGSTDTAICAVQVLNQGFTVVGYRELELSASGNYETFVNTTELGVSGHIDKCWLK